MRLKTRIPRIFRRRLSVFASYSGQNRRNWNRNWFGSICRNVATDQRVFGIGLEIRSSFASVSRDQVRTVRSQFANGDFASLGRNDRARNRPAPGSANRTRTARSIDSTISRPAETPIDGWSGERASPAAQNERPIQNARQIAYGARWRPHGRSGHRGAGSPRRSPQACERAILVEKPIEGAP